MNLNAQSEAAAIADIRRPETARRSLPFIHKLMSGVSGWFSFCMSERGYGRLSARSKIEVSSVVR